MPLMHAIGIVRLLMLAVGALITLASTVALIVVLVLTRSRARLAPDPAARGRL